MFFKRREYRDSVDLTIGVVYIKSLNNKIINKAMIGSTVAGSIINNALFFYLIEKQLVVLSRKQWNNLSVKDGEKLRLKIKEILTRHGLIDEEVKKELTPKNEQFSGEEIAFFQRTGNPTFANS